MAEKYPKIIREISDYGFEIGSHNYLHQLAYEQDRKTFNDDVKKSIQTLEDCTGKKYLVLGHQVSVLKILNGLLKSYMN